MEGWAAVRTESRRRIPAPQSQLVQAHIRYAGHDKAPARVIVEGDLKVGGIRDGLDHPNHSPQRLGVDPRDGRADGARHLVEWRGRGGQALDLEFGEAKRDAVPKEVVRHRGREASAALDGAGELHDVMSVGRRGAQAPGPTDVSPEEGAQGVVGGDPGLRRVGRRDGELELGEMRRREIKAAVRFRGTG